MFRFLTGGKKLPPFLEEYERRCALRVSGGTPLEQLHFVVFDTETTGLDLRSDRLLSFGGIAIRNLTMHLADSLEIVVQQLDVSVQETADIHGILKSHADQGMEPAVAVKEIIEFAGSAILVGHHVDFDRKMLDKTLRQCYPGARLRNKVIDTAALALRVEHFNDDYVYKSGDYTLDALCERYHLPVNDRHTAAGDAFITAQLFLKLLSRCRARKIRTYRQLMGKVRF